MTIVLSYLGTKIYAMSSFGFDGTAKEMPAQAVELRSITKIGGIGISREVKSYRPLDSDGYEIKAGLGFSVEDLSISAVRTDVADETWNFFVEKAKQAKESDAWFELLVVKPTNAGYEGELFKCIISKFSYEANIENGQEYEVTLARSGAPKKVTITDVSGTLKYAIA